MCMGSPIETRYDHISKHNDWPLASASPMTVGFSPKSRLVSRCERQIFCQLCVS